MIKNIAIICAIFFLLFNTTHSANNSLWPGDSLNFGFYSAIHNNINSTVNTLRKKELQKYSTFWGFGSHCRPNIAAIDRERMDESILIELTHGITSWLVKMFAKNNTTIDSDSLNNLSSCFSETYRRMTDEAQKDESSLSQISIIGIYSDGDTNNSDYDIIADIEKIDSILFAEKLDYIWEENTAKSSFASLARGDSIPHIFEWMSGVILNNDIIISEEATWWTIVPRENAEELTLEGLGIGATCSVEWWVTSGWVTIANMIDSAFIADLWNIMGEYSPWLQNTASHTYGNNLSGIPRTLSNNTKNISDFFNSRPCSGNFCIKIKMVSGWGNALAGWQTYSIESLLNKHTKIMEPIANSNLSAQKHQKNSFQLPFLNITLGNKISGWLIFMEDKPQLQKKYKEEYTQEMQDQEFDNLQKCAYIHAWLPWDKDRANIPYGVWYQFRTTSNSDNTQLYKKTLSVLDPSEESMSVACMQIALWKPREEYYTWLNTDLTELEVFTSALIGQISSAIFTDKKLDTLRSK